MMQDFGAFISSRTKIRTAIANRREARMRIAKFLLSGYRYAADPRKTKIERASAPLFSLAIEVLSYKEAYVHM
jgi:hypothetical protein